MMSTLRPFDRLRDRRLNEQLLGVVLAPSPPHQLINTSAHQLIITSANQHISTSKSVIKSQCKQFLKLPFSFLVDGFARCIRNRKLDIVVINYLGIDPGIDVPG